MAQYFIWVPESPRGWRWNTASPTASPGSSLTQPTVIPEHWKQSAPPAFEPLAHTVGSPKSVSLTQLVIADQFSPTTSNMSSSSPQTMRPRTFTTGADCFPFSPGSPSLMRSMFSQQDSLNLTHLPSWTPGDPWCPVTPVSAQAASTPISETMTFSSRSSTLTQPITSSCESQLRFGETWGASRLPGTPTMSPCVPGTPTRNPCVPGTPTMNPCVPGTPTRNPCVPGTPTMNTCVPGTPTRNPCVPGTPTMNTCVPGTQTMNRCLPGTPAMSPHVPGTPTMSPRLPGTPTGSPGQTVLSAGQVRDSGALYVNTKEDRYQDTGTETSVLDLNASADSILTDPSDQRVCPTCVSPCTCGGASNIDMIEDSR